MEMCQEAGEVDRMWDRYEETLLCDRTSQDDLLTFNITKNN